MNKQQARVLRKKLIRYFNHMSEIVGCLYDRWQDEKEYEDFKEYEKAMKKKSSEFPGKIEFLRASKRPFGFFFRIEDCKSEFNLKLSRGKLSLAQC